MNRSQQQRLKWQIKSRASRSRSSGNGLLIITLLLFVLFIYAFTTLPTREDGFERTDTEKTYSPRQLRKDFNFLFKTLQDVHPDLYAYVTREEIEAERDRIDASLDIPLTRLEAYRRFAPMVSRFEDGHTMAVLPRQERDEYAEMGALLFPLDLTFGEDAVRVARNFTSDTLVAAGTQVIEINGLPIEQIEDRLLQFVSGEQISWKRHLLSERFRWLLYLAYGIESPYEVTTLRTTQRGTTRLTRTFLGLTHNDLEKRRANLLANEMEEPAWRFELLEDPAAPNVGLLDFNRFEDLDGFAVFLDSTFRTLRERETMDLVIDLRGNAGGDSQLGDLLVEYLYDQPFRMVSRMDVKVSRQVKKYYASWLPWYLRWNPPLADEFFQRVWQAREGEVVQFDLPLTQPHEMAFRFHGAVYLLIDSGTFSSAVLFAAAMNDYGIATLVGEETGGLANTFGELYPFKLPETRLLFTASSKKFLRPSGVDGDRGVLPDFTVNPADFARRPVADPGLATVHALIREDRRTRP